jgi:TatD DNase family protein
MTELFDSHAHLDMPELIQDIDGVLKRAEDAGVKKIIIPGVCIDDMQAIITLIEKYDNLYGAASCHPECVEKFNDKSYDQLKEILKHPKMVAVGETGLDYYWTKDNKELQKEVFDQHIKLAKENNLPLIIHNRDAHADTYEFLKFCKSIGVNGVMHCFSGSSEFAIECVKEGFYIALGGPVTFKNAVKPKEVVATVPLDKLLIETDSPYLTPHPFRGKKPNEPLFVKIVAEEFARIKNVTLDEVALQTTQNTKDLFNIND